MIETTLVKTHLIIDSIEERFDINWCGKIINTDPLIKNGKPVFVIIGSESRMELNTTDISHLEDCAKRLTAPKGKTAITADTAYIYIKEKNGNETLMCIVRHKRIKHFVPMYDEVGWK